MIRWRNPTFQKWLQTVVFVLFLVVGIPSIASRIGSSPGVWDWAYVLVLIIAIGTAGWTAFSAWTGRTPTVVPAVSASQVEKDDVHLAIRESSGRIESIKALRTMYPGLGLGDAVHLVDEAQKL